MALAEATATLEKEVVMEAGSGLLGAIDGAMSSNSKLTGQLGAVKRRPQEPSDEPPELWK